MSKVHISYYDNNSIKKSYITENNKLNVNDLHWNENTVHISKLFVYLFCGFLFLGVFILFMVRSKKFLFEIVNRFKQWWFQLIKAN